jgi:GTP 3',8-cyclase
MLTDKYLRKHNYLRISLTDKCNLRCKYCIPAEGVQHLTHDEILRNEEFLSLIKIFSDFGVTKLRFTGGEPLVRKGFMNIIEKTREMLPNIELCLTTNGILLGHYLEDLKKFNLTKLNISLDTFNRERFEEITGFDLLDRVTTNLDTALKLNSFNIKVNTVLFKETLSEIDHFLEYFKGKNITLRFIERMPFTDEEENFKFIPGQELIDLLETKGKLVRNKKIDTSVSVMYDLLYKDKYTIKIGIIPPVSHKFCSSCNRLRLTSNGNLRTCLYDTKEYDLKTDLRNNDIEKVKNTIIESVKCKEEGHKIDCNSETHGCSSLINSPSMSRIGG